MNKEETLALYAKGRDAWNAWAEEMLAKRRTLEEAGEWNVGPVGGGRNQATRDWQTSAQADFSERKFENDSDFSGFTFPGDAGFDSATFEGDARFGSATFEGTAGFDSATFEGDARFVSATFQGDAWFGRATFQGDAWFVLSEFNGITAFDRATFGGDGNFHAFVANSAFSMADASFRAVPDFIQARFSEPPRLDDLSIEPRGFRAGIVASVKATFKSDSDDAVRNSHDEEARWRWLKKLAVAGHDHEREQAFFKQELLALRWQKGARWRGAFWFGLAYQLFSDFGRSPSRPLLWLLASVVGFAGYYLGRYFTATGRTHSVSLAFWERAKAVVMDDASPIATCALWPGDPVAAAFGLSVRNAVLFAGAGLSDKLKQIHGCLWGGHSPDPLPYAAMPVRFVPDIPDSIAFLGVAQSLLSAALIFLFLLALRNHFRIK